MTRIRWHIGLAFIGVMIISVNLIHLWMQEQGHPDSDVMMPATVKSCPASPQKVVSGTPMGGIEPSLPSPDPSVKNHSLESPSSSPSFFSMPPVASTQSSGKFASSKPSPLMEEVIEIQEPAPTPEPITIPAALGNPVVRANLSPEQQSMLDHAASNFNAAIQNSGMSPYAPGYADLWRQATMNADDAFRSKYGDATLNALKGIPETQPTPEPTPTPLSPEDDAYRSRYGDDALLFKQAEDQEKKATGK